VKIVAARVTPVRLALRDPLTTAHGVIDVREGAVLALEDEAGRRGFGEALPLPGFGLETSGEALDALEGLAQASVAAPASSLDARLDAAERARPRAPSARGALDVALHDLAAQRDALPLAAWLAQRVGTAPRPRVATGRLLASSRPDDAAAEARDAVSEGFTTLKLKVGSDDPERDRARVACVREAVGPGVALRLDANGAWSETTALACVRRLAPYAIELLEQPVAAGETASLARVRAEARFPIAADEAVRDASAAAELLDAGAADLLVLKPAALGGLRASARIAALARAAGVGVIVTSFLDSALGVTAALHLAASLPDDGHAAGLATADRLREDGSPSSAIRRGCLPVPTMPGLGTRPDPARLAALAAGDPRELRA